MTSTNDPQMDILNQAINDLAQHTAQNRSHAEQGLYTEALPRILSCLRALREAMDSEPPEQGIDEGAFVSIRYGTAQAIENYLASLKEEKGDDIMLNACSRMLYQDLYGTFIEFEEPEPHPADIIHLPGPTDEDQEQNK